MNKVHFITINLILSFNLCYGQDSLSLQEQRDKALLALFASDLSTLNRDSSAEYIFSEGINERRIRISSVKESSKTVKGGCCGTRIYYQGHLLKGIAHLLNSDMLYLRTKGKVPNAFVYYYGERSFTDSLDMVQRIRTVLENKYKFKIVDTKEMCEVWQIQKTDTSKLIYYNPLLHDGTLAAGPMDNDSTKYTAFGFPLTFLCKDIEWAAKTIVRAEDGDESWNKTYDFDNIPYAIMGNLEGLNGLLEARYGIKFIKTKVLQDLKLIQFEE